MHVFSWTMSIPSNALAISSASELGSLTMRVAPAASSQIEGAIERFHPTLAAQVRTMRMESTQYRGHDGPRVRQSAPMGQWDDHACAVEGVLLSGRWRILGLARPFIAHGDGVVSVGDGEAVIWLQNAFGIRIESSMATVGLDDGDGKDTTVFNVTISAPALGYTCARNGFATRS